MSELKIFWQGINDRTAVAWLRETADSGVTMTSGPYGIVQWGDVTWESLQGVQLSRLASGRRGYPEWEQDDPPTWGEIETRWAEGAKERARAARRTQAQILATAGAGVAARNGTQLVPKQPGESADDFYRRVAIFYRAALQRDGKPTAAIVETAGVPKTTAARWVREARLRGFLEPTTRGRGRA